MASLQRGFAMTHRTGSQLPSLVSLTALLVLRALSIEAQDQPAASSPALHSTLAGKVMCGYQGWFAAEGDGSNSGWVHYGFHKPGQCQIDLWPDMREFPRAERFPTPLRYVNDEIAEVFSSVQPGTVLRHFEWMRSYGIDGVFLQRFGTVLKDSHHRERMDQVLDNVRAAARQTGRSWCVMYDLSGLRKGEILSVVMQDWKRLRNELRVIDDETYQLHRGRPLVAVWGIGFNDGRDYTLDECGELLRFLRNNPEFGGTTVMAGVPWGWREKNRDAVPDPQLHDVLQIADVVSPWAVGRYGSPFGAAQEITKVHADDQRWCDERKKDYLPVIFPGFSWHNLQQSRGRQSPLNQIPRLGGRFLWSQAVTRFGLGSRMLYVAMFDEMDEGTAIFKFANKVPAWPGGFVTEPGLPSDHYLWLTGQIGRLLREEIEASDQVPLRK